MQRYKCLNCKGVFCGWAVRYKLKYKCPNCGGELQEVYDDNREFQRDPIVKILKTRKNLRSGNL